MKRLGLAVCMWLGACGTYDADGQSGISALERLAGEPEDVVPRFVALLRAEAPSLQVGFVELGSATNLLLERQDGELAYWLTADGAHVILRSGMLQGTRGLGEGLLAADVGQSLGLVRSRQTGTALRRHSYLDGADRAEVLRFDCRIDNRGPRRIETLEGSVTADLMTEACQGAGLSFENLYWVRPSTGRIVLSRQWAGPILGPLSFRAVPE